MVFWLLAVLLVGACARENPTSIPEPQATSTVAAVLPHSSETSAFRPSPEATLPSPEPAPPTPMMAPIEPLSTPRPVEPTARPTPHTSQPGPLPEILTRIPLAPPEAELDDLLLDSGAGRLYVTDTSGQLHVLDSATYEEIARVAASGKLTLDPDSNRLYVSLEADEGELTVIDTQDLTVVGTLTPGGHVALDSKRGRFYVGNPTPWMPNEDASGLRVYDAETLNKVGTVAQPGIPAYNALRDELYVIAYTAHIVDPDTLEITGDLMPEITEQPLAWCNGCLAATNAHVYPDRKLLVVEVTILSAGKGPGTTPPPRFYHATTLEEIVDLAETPPVERGCQHRLILADPVGDRVYRGEHYSRYFSHNNLLISDPDGNLETWRDGLGLGITNPNTGQMYVTRGQDLLVLDLAALQPAGTLPPICVHTLDTENGRIYGFYEGDLVVLSESGGWPTPPPTGEPEPRTDSPLVPGQVISIQPSPDYARDQTVFVTLSNRHLYRSRDGGQTWAQLQGGLPAGQYLTLDLAISPDFGTDQTLFAGGAHREFWGEGVYRSTDGGDTWQPVWKDLTHLRVYDVALSPNYSADGTLLAYSRYQRIRPWQGGDSVFRSTDRGLSWTLVMTNSQAADLPLPEQLLPAARAQPAIQYRKAGYGQSLERSLDGAKTWQPLVITGQPDFSIQAVQKSPTFSIDHTVYVLGGTDLFRSTDGGQTWERWHDERLAGRDHADRLADVSTSPVLPDGRHQLLVGTYAGEFWTLDPERLSWEPVFTAARWPTVLEGEWVSEIETAPDGSVWLGTWGSGLAHYANGAIQARHTITDGLSTQYIGAMAADPGGRFWAAGALPPGISSFDGDTWTPHPHPESYAPGATYDLTSGQDGSIWAGGQAPGLLRWTGQDWEFIADPEALTGWRVNDIEIDDAGTLWAATAKGLIFYSDAGWSGEGSQAALDVELGPGGTAYLLLSDASVWRYADRHWEELPSLRERRALSAAALHVAADGAVWVGTHTGAFRYDGQGWQQFTVQDGLPANDVGAINEDADGWLWFGTSNGAAHVEPETLDLGPVVRPALAAPTAIPRMQATATPCALRPADPFATVYMDRAVAGKLHCPTAGARSSKSAYQPFERGLMFWRAHEQAVYVLDAGGGWIRYPDAWDDTQPQANPDLVPPAGLLQPVRGFGKVWRERLGGPGASTGWALAEEQSFEMLYQSFVDGQMFVGPRGEVYLLYADSTWEARN